MDKEVHAFFTGVDWAVVVAYLVFTTWIGHALRGKQANIRDFFLGGRTLPWPAVTGSIIATEISALTFIGVPGTVFAVGGDFTYLQWAIGSIMARFAVGYWLVPLYYKQEIYSPYDFMGIRLGAAVKKLVTLLFSMGAILGQSVRVLVTAIILKVVTGLPIEWCIVAIGAFAVAWTWMGGMRTVIWTDVVQFFLFICGGLVALIWLLSSVDGGWKAISEGAKNAQYVEFTWKEKNQRRTIYQVQGEEGAVEQVAVETDKKGKPTLVGKVTRDGRNVSIQIGEQSVPATVKGKNKMQLLELRFFDEETKSFLIFTLWIALFAMPFNNFGAFGTDQLMAQRMFCCKDARDARRAVIWSSVSQLITVLMLLVSAGLYVWYQQKAISPAEFALFVEEKNNVFPVWITKVLPVGLSGLLIAGAFAAAISSLDSILAALSQTTLSAIYGDEKFAAEQHSKRMVWKSRMMVIVWGIALSAFAILLNVLYQKGEKNLIDFAFRMLSYTYGPMIGILFLAILPVKASVRGIVIGTLVSAGLAAWALPDLFNFLEIIKIEGASKHKLNLMAFPWFYPLNAAITFLCGWGFAGFARSRTP